MRWLPLALGLVVLLMSSESWHKPLAHKLEVTSAFGQRGAVTTPDGHVLPAGFHAGIDLRAAVGSPLLSVSEGRVMAIENGSSGRILRVEDARGGRVSYVHLNTIEVQAGQAVARGQRLGTTGNSGGVAPHLHLEYRPPPWRSTNAVDPSPMLGNPPRAA